MEKNTHTQARGQRCPEKGERMIDAFDIGFDAPAPAPSTPAPQARQYEMLAAGVHDLEIIAASVGTVAWKTSEANPTGECLRLRLSAGRGVSFVFADLPRDRQFMFKALAASLGLEPGPDGKVSIGPAEGLIGRRARVEIGHYTTRAGETRATVKRWLPVATAPSTAPAASTTSRPSTAPKAAPCRTQSTKAAASFRAAAAEDDIPF
jgi:hypothetical protein